MTMRIRRRRATLALAANRFAAEQLEPRQLFAATVVGPIPDAAGVTGSSQTIDLMPYFSDPKYSVVRLATTSGNVDIQTLDQDVPLNAANFLQYVTSGRYNGTYFHRPVENFVLQGGSFYTDDTDVPEFAPVASEPNGSRSNVRGTVAFARLPAFQDTNGNGIQDSGEPSIPGGGPNSGTSGFFVNLADNAANLDAQNGGFTVFGNVLGNGMTVVDALTTAGLANARSAVINTAALTDDVTYTVTSSDPTAVAGSIVDGNLVLTYGGTGGSANITVTATDLDGATSVQSTFAANATFGVVLGGDSGVKSANFADADGTVTNVSIKGNGSATLAFDGTGLTQTTAKGKTTISGTGVAIAQLNVTGSDAKTAVTISSKGGDGISTVADVSVDGAVRSITGKGVSLTGTLSTGGAVAAVTLGSVNGGTLSLGGAATDKGSALSLGTLTDATVDSLGTIRSLKVTSAVNVTSTTEGITASSIGSVSSAGDFAASITAPGEGDIGSVKVNGNLTGDVAAHQIGTISVRGDISGATITASHGAAEATNPNGKNDRGIGTLAARGALTGVTVNSAGSVGTISAASVTASLIVLGAPTLTTLPTSLADLAQPATLNAMKIKGAYANTITVARFIGKASVGSVTLANGGVPFGFAADTVASLSGRTDLGQKFAIKKADTQADVDSALTGATLTDAVIRLV